MQYNKENKEFALSLLGKNFSCHYSILETVIQISTLKVMSSIQSSLFLHILSPKTSITKIQFKNTWPLMNVIKL